MNSSILRIAPLALMLVFLASSARADDKTNTAPVTPPAPSATITAPADVQAAIAMPADSAPNKAARDTALKAAAGVWAKTNPIDAMNLGAAIPDKSMQRDVVEAAANVWVSADEKTALDWAIHQATAYQRHFIFGQYGSKERQAAAEWTLKLPQHDAGEFSVVMEAWCGHAKDNQATTTEAAVWLLQQKNLTKADSDAALFFVAGAKTWNDPAATAAWVSNLSPNFSKVAAGQSVVNIWSRKTPADIPKIRDWIQTLPVSDADKATLNKAIVTK